MDSENSQSSKKWELFKLVAGVICTIATTIIAVTVFLVTDRESVCKGTYEKFGSVFILPCVQVGADEADVSIQNFYTKSAGSNSYNGWELLSTELKSSIDYQTFEAQWEGVAYAEIRSVTKSVENEYNTFNVDYLVYRVDDSDRLGGTNEYSGYLDNYRSKVRLGKSGKLWMIEDLVSVNSRGDVRKRISFARAEITAKGVHTLEFPWSDAAKIYGPEFRSTLPVYCSHADMQDKSKNWYRTSMGWINGEDVQLESGQEPKSCEGENFRIIELAVNLQK